MLVIYYSFRLALYPSIVFRNTFKSVMGDFTEEDTVDYQRYLDALRSSDKGEHIRPSVYVKWKD